MDCFTVIMIVIPLVHSTRQLRIMPIEPRCSDSTVSSAHMNLRCCMSYRTIGGKCYPCIGSFGLECSKPCPKGYYGLNCECDRCNATTGNCFYERNSSRISVVSLALVTTGGVLFLTALLTCLCIIRDFLKKRLGNYVLDSSHIESASEIRMDGILSYECEQPSVHYHITRIYSETQV